MRKVMTISVACLSLLLLSLAANAQQISGDYLETRNADIWTGACVANGELNLAGDQAILAWHVTKGRWNGVPLDGLGVVGVVKAAATLGDQYNNPYPAQAVMIVDSKANAAQQKALVGMAQKMAGGELLENVVEIRIAPIEMTVGKMEMSHHGGQSATASLRAGTMVGVETRDIGGNDHLCGNENIYYAPLVKLVHSMPAVAELDEYDGPGLGVIWTLRGKRSAFVGRFAF
ncbi:MAG: hypothetical protein JWM21_2443 [Acidobacteria bacterium]|nr:hypothetical protein [Acidobacteriota bacterium]